MTAHRSHPPRRTPAGLGPAAAACTLLGVLTAAWPATPGVPGTAPVLAAGGPAGSSVTADRAPDPVPQPVAGAQLVAGVEQVGAPGGIPVTFADAAPDGARVRIAIEFALAQLGLPYVWGGNGPAAGHAGFDCSGLTTASYAAAGVRLPRTAHTQYHAGPHVPTGAALYPGDLVFYGVPSRVHHVGLYLGEGRMVAAPTFGKPVRVSYLRWRGDDFLGATRPAGTGLRGGRLPPLPAPVPGALVVQSPVSEVFAAPPAPLTPTLADAVPPGTAPPAGPTTEGGPAPVDPTPTPTPTPTPAPTPTSPAPTSTSSSAPPPDPVATSTEASQASVAEGEAGGIAVPTTAPPPG